MFLLPNSDLLTAAFSLLEKSFLLDQLPVTMHR